MGSERQTGHVSEGAPPIPQEGRAVRFRNWENALAEGGLWEEMETRARREIPGFPRFLKGLHAPASIAMARRYFDEPTGQGRSEAEVEEAQRDVAVVVSVGARRDARASVPDRSAIPYPNP